jgi:bifunctional pyridoxal-dependent enzyme with beta-cystathionase and maltose regulon repressor activities
MSQIVVKAMLIVRNGEKLLFSRGYDSVKKQPFLRPLGGHVEFGETGEETIKREMQEEVECAALDIRFLSVVENLFTYNGKKGHELVLVYEGRLSDESLYRKDTLVFMEGDRKSEASWFSRIDVEKEDIPIYPPFLTAPEYSDRRVITVPFEQERNRWILDPDRIEAAVTPRTRMLMLCNPQNPTGRVFSRTELIALAEICLRHHLVICSDEIHCDLILDQNLNHIPMATLSPEIAQQTITLMAPSKTYNIPGLGCSFAVIPNSELRGKFLRVKRGIIPDVNMLGYTACLAAYQHGSEWLNELRDYLRGNRDLIRHWIDHEIPGLQLSHIEATYLAWIDVRQVESEDPVRLFERFGVGLSDGRYFGWPGFVRLNMGCPRSLLLKGLQRMRTATVSHTHEST